MKRILCLMLALALVLMGCCAAAEDNPDTPVDFNSLPADYRALYEAEMASALANARSRAPEQSRLIAAVRGDFNGYTGSKSDNSLKVEYRVTDSVVEVGEKVVFYVTMSWDYGKLTYTFGGQMMDADFDPLGPIVPTGASNTFVTPEGDDIPEGTKTVGRAFSFTPGQAGYFNYVIILKDGNGNKLALTTPTIQVYDGDIPNFGSIGTDKDIGLDVENNLAMQVTLDKTDGKVGDEITATATFSTLTDPVKYTASWTLNDAAGNELDVLRTTGEVNASGKKTSVSFPYMPLNGGEMQFLITATDGDGNQVKINSPWLTVEDGYYFTARLNRVSAMMIGDSVTATYHIYGHECDAASYFIGWECYDENGRTVSLETKNVADRSGKESYVPHVGQGLEFYIGATCEHISGAYPARVTLALVGSIQAEAALTADSVSSGEKIGVNYSISGGVDPYQQILINGYSYDESRNKTYNFLTASVTETEGTVYGVPYLGDEVYFVLKVVEADGYTSTWTTEKADMTGAPEVTDPTLIASVDKTKAALGDAVTMTWKMSGGSGTLNKTDAGSSYLKWKLSDGTVVKTEAVTRITGSSIFTPETEGTYFCELVLTDGYNQRISWVSETITVSAVVRIPGDADDNGIVNLYDALRIMQYDAGWSVSLNKRNADVNSSGGVDLNDALLIFRYGAGEDIVLQ